MKLILGKINRQYLRSLTDAAAEETEYVEAAVAYATDAALLFDWCWDHKILLRYWGRFDETVPVTVPILKKFLDRRSPNFTCKLVRHFHPKVIWWRGFGAYVGSANLTGAAWFNNVEAGVFIPDAELESSGQALELERFFAVINEHASPLTDELLRAIERRENTLQAIRKSDKREKEDFCALPLVKTWGGLAEQSERSAAQAAKENFVNEWNSTLTILRNLAARVSKDENRPAWISLDVPGGAQGDQFLHAHYYFRTFEGRQAKFEEFYERHRINPDAAEREAIDWWRQLKEPPGTERQMLEEWGPFLRKRLAKERVLGLTEQDVVEICSRVYAIRDHARRVANAALGLLPREERYTVEEKAEALAHHLWRSRSGNGSTVPQLIHWVLYGGSRNDVPERLWEAISTPDRRIDHFGIAALGELVGWAFPDTYAPRNGRTSKSLRSLGHDVTVHS